MLVSSFSQDQLTRIVEDFKMAFESLIKGIYRQFREMNILLVGVAGIGIRDSAREDLA